MSNGPPFDVFLSYNSEDFVSVKYLAVALEDKAELRPWFDKWQLIPGEPWQRGIERGISASRSCAVFVGSSGRGPWQAQEVEAALRAQVGNGEFRVIPVLLPDAPEKAPDLPMFLQGHTWVQFENLDDDGTLWHLECGIMGRSPERGRPASASREIAAEESGHLRAFRLREPVPYLDPKGLTLPGGAIDTQARYYVLRKADEQVIDTVRRPRGLATVRGPRQSGKTSLILRTYEAVRQTEGDLRAAFVDFQALPHGDFESLEAIWRAITDLVAEQLLLDDWEETWREKEPYVRNLNRFLDRQVFRDTNERLLLCLDEVDRVFHTVISTEFFGSVRAFYNRGASDRSWKRVSWLLGTSSEPKLFITDLNQSPFNIGQRVELSPFSLDQISDFAARFGLSPEAIDARRIFDYVGGQPYLVHLILYHLACGEMEPERLFDVEAAARTVFQEHLLYFLLRCQQEEPLARAMKEVVIGKGCADARLADRLEAAGLARRDESEKLVPFCELYAKYFRKEL